MEIREEKTGKRIWLVNQYAMPPRLESRLRTIKFAHYLQKAGYEVTIFASSIMHNMGMDLMEDDALYIDRQYEDLNFVRFVLWRNHAVFRDYGQGRPCTTMDSRRTGRTRTGKLCLACS